LVSLIKSIMTWLSTLSNKSLKQETEKYLLRIFCRFGHSTSICLTVSGAWHSVHDDWSSPEFLKYMFVFVWGCVCAIILLYMVASKNGSSATVSHCGAARLVLLYYARRWPTFNIVTPSDSDSAVVDLYSTKVPPHLYSTLWNSWYFFVSQWLIAQFLHHPVHAYQQMYHITQSSLSHSLDPNNHCSFNQLWIAATIVFTVQWNM